MTELFLPFRDLMPSFTVILSEFLDELHPGWKPGWWECPKVKTTWY